MSTLCKKLLARNLYKIKLQSKPFNSEEINELQVKAMQQFKVDSSLIPYFVHTGTANNTMYKTEDERINILYKDGTVKDISAIDNPLIHQTISAPIKKFYICLLEP
ncbi:MAG TPA: hypothetical protein PKZ66_09300 [Chitinophagaceae bacterium]|nr:hypothetical protein [Chitinophagaceae bacterium]